MEDWWENHKTTPEEKRNGDVGHPESQIFEGVNW